MTSDRHASLAPRSCTALHAWVLVLVVAATTVLAPAAHAQLTLGDQRVGTTSAGFLRIGIGARAAALGDAFVAVANDPSAIYWNPAGLASMQRSQLLLSHIDWPASIHYEHGAWVVPVRRLGGSLAVQLGVLSTEIDETTELQPFGTGRSFFYSDAVAGVAYARRWTDKLLVGVGGKWVREDLGSDIGGPRTNAILVDVGSIYYLGYGSVRIATSLSNFGSQLTPKDPHTSGGGWVSPVTGEHRDYDGFDPPTVFRYGIAFEPIENAQQRLTAALEANQPADNALSINAGAEWTWTRRLALRAGYNFNADEFKLSAGAGVYASLGQTQLNFDYAYTQGDFLGVVNRMSLGVRF